MAGQGREALVHGATRLEDGFCVLRQRRGTPTVRDGAKQRDQRGGRGKVHAAGVRVLQQRRVGLQGRPEKGLTGQEQHHELRGVGELLPVRLVGKPVDVCPQVSGVRHRALGPHPLVSGLHGLEIRREGDLGVDDDAALTRQPDDQVGAQQAVRPAHRHLRVEVAAVQHPGVLDDPAQLQLPPLPTGLWTAQRGHQRGGLTAEPLGALTDLADLCGQLADLARAVGLERPQLVLDLLELVMQGPDDGIDTLLAPGEVGVIGAPALQRELGAVQVGAKGRGAGGRDSEPEGEADQQGCEQGDQVHAGTVARASDSSAQAGSVVAVSLSIGIVGLPNVGKSTLFNALTKNDVLAANYPFATIEPNIGVVGVPDARLGVLAQVFASQKVIPATVDFVDIAGIVKGASEGEGLGNKFLASIRDSDAICQVVRAFKDDNVVHVDGRVSPKDDMETINTELILADLQTVERAIPRLEKEVRLKRESVAVLDAVRQAQAVLDSGRTIYQSGVDRGPLRELQLLTAKPFLYVFNLDEDELADPAVRSALAELVAPAEAVFLDAKVESELIEMAEDEALELLQSMGQQESGLHQLARIGFDTLGLQTYLTAGPKETRAWTIPKGATAPEAAGVIHTDFQRGFIKAEVIGFADLVELGSVVAARSAGKARMEGKDYVMQDGDVVEFRFNV